MSLLEPYYRLLGWSGFILGGLIGWKLGSYHSLYTASFAGLFCGAVGLYLGRRLARRHF